MIRIKRFILGTWIGRQALAWRETMTLWNAVRTNPEILGGLANDHLARVILPRLSQATHAFVDVGAHYGSVVAEVLHANPEARVIAFEPVPDKAQHMRRKFPRVEVHACAVSDLAGEATFFVNQKESACSTLIAPANNGPDIVAIQVPVATLDDTIDGFHVDVIKIDAEGAELSVLKGGRRIISTCRPTILFESASPACGHGSAHGALWDWFSEHDYSVVVPNRLAHNDPGLERSGFLESHLYPRRTTNYFAVARERRMDIRDQARHVLEINDA